LTALRRSRGDHFSHVYDHGAGGIEDPDIPVFCRRNRIDVIITANVRDFGARKTMYLELLNAGTHVAVVRFGRAQPTIEVQNAVISLGLQRLTVLLEEKTEPTLFRISNSGQCVDRSIEELIAEITGSPRLP
jgi:hypothetical protein